MNIVPRFPSISTDVHIGVSLYSKEFAELIASLGAHALLFADSALAKIHAEPLLHFLKQHRIPIELILLPSGEACKTRETKALLEDELFKKRIGKNSVFIALGGGTTCDLVGFLAATYMRGVPHVLLPSTLLAMADASLGGKNGINTSFGKNLIGTIHHPKAIWMDLALLNTLPQQEYLSGLAEIIKMGLIADASLIERIEQKGFDPHNHSELAYLIQRAAELKIQIIEEDPEERSIRAILNFGHTVAHAIEQASNYTIPHGLAVALGCIAESYLSYHLDHLALLDAERIERLITTLGFPFMKLPVNLKASMHSDKKNQGGQIHFVLLKSLGNTYSSHGRFTHPVSDEAIDAMLAWLSQRTEKL